MTRRKPQSEYRAMRATFMREEWGVHAYFDIVVHRDVLDEDVARICADLNSLPLGPTARRLFRAMLDSTADHTEIVLSLSSIDPLSRAARPSLRLEVDGIHPWRGADFTLDPGEEHWLSIQGHDWVSSASWSVRRDAGVPLPAPADDELEWPLLLAAELVGDGVALLLDTVAGEATVRDHPGRFHARFRDTLAAGEVWSTDDPSGPAVVKRDGEAIAFVMPLLTEWSFGGGPTPPAINSAGTAVPSIRPAMVAGDGTPPTVH